jgi:hypothetical protein
MCAIAETAIALTTYFGRIMNPPVLFGALRRSSAFFGKSVWWPYTPACSREILACLLQATHIAGHEDALLPAGFRWGVATAGHQNEGDNTTSDTWFLEQTQPSVFRTPSGRACNG